MASDGRPLRLDDRLRPAEPTLADLLDPVALEQRLKEARIRRSEALARRKAPEQGPTAAPAPAPPAAEVAPPAVSVLLGWHVWAVVRIAGFVMIGVVLSGVVLSRVMSFPFSLRSERRWLVIGARLLVVGGNGPELDPAVTPELGRLMAIAREEGVADAVTFTGSRPREVLRNYYSAADVFVTTPWYEPFGITPLESMACGTPVAGADVGGIRCSVADGLTGHLVPPKDPARLAASLARMCTDADHRKELGRNAIDRVHEQFTWSKVARAIGALYEDVAAGTVRHVA